MTASQTCHQNQIKVSELTQLDEIARLSSAATAAAIRGNRTDLVKRLASLDEVLDNPGTYVAICGEFKQGKSTLVNTLVGQGICPVDDDIATAVPTFIQWADQPRAWVQRDDGDQENVSEPLDISHLEAAIVENPDSPDELADRVRVAIPSDTLQDGLVLVDTPGVGGLSSHHGATTLAALAYAEAFVFVSDASQEFTETELTFLRRAITLCSNAICVLSKTDLHGQWRRILDVNREHLDRAGIEVPIIAISSKLQALAAQHHDADLAAESGFAELESFLTNQVTAAADAGLVWRARTELFEIVDLLRAPYEAERAVLRDPAAAADLRRQLMAEKERIDALRSTAARWSTTLSDGMTDLTSDAQHDLRGRTRAITSEAEAAIDEYDPAAVWAEFEPWLYTRTSDEVLANYTMMQARAAELSDRVAEHFSEDQTGAHHSTQSFDPAGALGVIERSADANFDIRSVAAKGFGMVRGMQSGGFMFRSGTSLFLTAINPLALPMMAATAGVGLLMGRKGLSEERKRELAMSRARAKQSVRQYLDEVSFVIGKDSGDTMRRIQRELRDHYMDRADEMSRSAAESMRMAGRAVEQSEADRVEALAGVDAQIAELRAMQNAIRHVGADGDFR